MEPAHRVPILIAPNASSVLDHVGVLEQIASCAVYPRRMLLVDALSGETLTAADLGEPFLCAFRYHYVVMHRNDLLTILLDACQQHEAVTLENGSRLRGELADWRGDKTTTVWCDMV